ncbi:MAG: methyltransferase [Fimbriimonadaceae bacterium]|nr:methyltransferase [Chitinophagales bacterium]
MQLLKKIFAVTLQPVIAKRIYRTSYYKWEDITLRIPAGVFHPKYFFSTKYLLQHVLQLPLENKKVFELGAGNGLLSIACAKRNAIVTSSDISKRVIDALQENAQTNQVKISTVESDLFDVIPKQHFDIIAINPPYYPKDAKNELEKAWYCGENFEYFEKLFFQLGEYVNATSKILMVLSEDCNLERIFSIAARNHFNFTQIHTRKFYWERNYIFEIKRQ